MTWVEGAPVQVRLIGYWANEQHPEYPDPAAFVDEAWDADERQDVWMYLTNGLVVRAFMGPSPCRLCDERVGNLELTDGVYAWPEGLAHYVSDHAVRLPRTFVEHVKRQGARLDDLALDLAWWIESTHLRRSGASSTESGEPS